MTFDMQREHQGEAGHESIYADGDAGPQPRFWTQREQTAWDRVSAALHRDWLHGPGDWGRARHAIRLGHGAATSSGATVWSHLMEARLRGEWELMALDIPWERARPLVRQGWDQGVKDLSAGPDGRPSDAARAVL
jgi:hypothetical protein